MTSNRLKSKSFEIPATVKDFAEAASRQSRYSNQIWLALIAADALAIFPNIKDDKVELPFSLGQVDQDIFALVILLIVAVLTIAFCQANAQALRANRHAQKLMSNLKNDQARIFYDFYTYPSFARTSPLASLLNELAAKTKKISALASLYYAVLKIVAILILYGIPAASLITTYAKLVCLSQSGEISILISTFAFVLASVVVIQVFVAELCYIKNVACKYMNDEIH